MMARLDLDAIRRDHPLPEVAAQLVELRQAGQEFVACCPFHADRSPSFTVFRGVNGVWQAHCFGCGWHGDVLDLVQRAYSVSLPEAARMLGADAVPKVELPAARAICDPERREATQAEARAIWERGGNVAGSPAEAYLRFRGIHPPYPAALRFLRLPCGNLGLLPCLICAVQDLAGTVTGIQRIFLAQDGRGKADLPKPKLSLGAIKGGAIRLGDLDGSGCLTVCEGPEDGLSLMDLIGGPVWVSAGTSFLPAMQFPPEVRSIVIGADNDPAGKAAAAKAAQAYAARGLSVRVLQPLDGFKDFNDELRGADNGH